MPTYTQRDPLTDAELDRLGDFLEGCKGGKAMNLEELDGFFRTDHPASPAALQPFWFGVCSVPNAADQRISMLRCDLLDGR
jgi:tRNA splicing ligase